MALEGGGTLKKIPDLVKSMKMGNYVRKFRNTKH